MSFATWCPTTSRQLQCNHIFKFCWWTFLKYWRFSHLNEEMNCFEEARIPKQAEMCHLQKMKICPTVNRLFVTVYYSNAEVRVVHGHVSLTRAKYAYMNRLPFYQNSTETIFILHETSLAHKIPSWAVHLHLHQVTKKLIQEKSIALSRGRMVQQGGSRSVIQYCLVNVLPQMLCKILTPAWPSHKITVAPLSVHLHI